MATGLRSYPDPGKFEGELLIAPLVAEMADEELGDVQTIGWFGLVHAPFFSSADEATRAAAEADLGPLTAAELRLLLRKSGGAIVSEDSQGFVSVTWYDTKRGMMAEWRALKEEEADAEESEAP